MLQRENYTTNWTNTEVQTNYDRYKSQDRYLRFELFLSHLTDTCSNTKEWRALFTCITGFKGLYKYKGADFVVIVAQFLNLTYPTPIAYFLLIFLPWPKFGKGKIDI